MNLSEQITQAKGELDIEIRETVSDNPDHNINSLFNVPPEARRRIALHFIAYMVLKEQDDRWLLDLFPQGFASRLLDQLTGRQGHWLDEEIAELVLNKHGSLVGLYFDEALRRIHRGDK